ncbi:MAG: ABC transporter permease [Myxococcota bacterium]|nr:ABC transporter permease [Myxococcota bacterium]
MSLLDLDTWSEIAQTVRRNRLRAALTAAGVFWGMFMLLLMQGFGNGMENGVQRTMGDFSTNSVYLWGRRTAMPYRGHRSGRPVEFSNADTDVLAQLPEIVHLAPRLQLGGYRSPSLTTHNGKSGGFPVAGDVPAYRAIQPMAIDEGRFLNDLDLADRRKVAVLGQQVVDELFERGEAPVGAHVTISGIDFTVVGVFHSTIGGDDGDRFNSTIHVPFSTFQQTFQYGDSVGWYALTGRPDVDAAVLEAEVRSVLAARHGIHPEDERAMGSFNASEEFTRLRKLFDGISLLVWFVGAMTLLSGVIGVSNIMLISVQERTREIGVRRAIGASRQAVVVMILQEAVALTLTAGYVGLVCGVGFLEVLSQVVGPDSEVLSEPGVDLSVALGAATLLVVLGAFAGLLPAIRAAAIHPVVALRAD